MVRRVDDSNLGGSASTGPAPWAHAWIEVDLDVLHANVAKLRRRYASDCRLIAVVKSDAYGHGAVPIAHAALAAGAAGLAVASAAEGAELRTSGIAAEILIIGPSVPEEAELILEHDLVAAVADRALADVLERLAERPCAVHVEVDTGLRRHGVGAGGALDLVRHVRSLRAVRLSGVYTHFASITPSDQPLAAAQFDEFRHVLRLLRCDGPLPLVHACNTLSSTLLPDAHFDAVRIGGGLHGLGATARALGLEPTLTLKSRIVGLRRVASGDRVGYAGAHVCERDTVLALLPCGYADGMPRTAWHRTDVLVRGRRAPITGLISMNQTLVDVGHVPDVTVGDEVVLLGPQGHERIRAEERVLSGGSTYEVTTLLRPDLPRAYLSSQRVRSADPAERTRTDGSLRAAD